jgi:hypothetical protein
LEERNLNRGTGPRERKNARWVVVQEWYGRNKKGASKVRRRA